VRARTALLAADGCPAELALADIDAHEAACEYAVLTCGRRVGARACGAEFRRREQAEHDEVCAARPGVAAQPQPAAPHAMPPPPAMEYAWQPAPRAAAAAWGSAGDAFESPDPFLALLATPQHAFSPLFQQPFGAPLFSPAFSAFVTLRDAPLAYAPPPTQGNAPPPPYWSPSRGGAPPAPSPWAVGAYSFDAERALAAQFAASSLRRGALTRAAGEKESNGFLTAIVQALRHVHRFRRHLLGAVMPPGPPAGAPPQVAPCIIALVTALQQLFVALRDGIPLAPTALREALAALPGVEGVMHQMTEASEVLGCMYAAFQEVSAAFRPGIAADATPVGRMFGMAVAELVACAGCGAATHRQAYSQFFHIVHAAALRAVAAAPPRGATFESLLHSLLSGGTKCCDRDERGCGLEAPNHHLLLRCPEVFTISVAWDTAAAPEAEVAATMAALGTSLRPELVYSDISWQLVVPPFELRALVCYESNAMR
jgi:hypothetical protein